MRPAALALFFFVPALAACQSAGALQVKVRYKPELASRPLDGRLLLVVATDDKREPREQVTDGDDTAQVYGMDVDGWTGGQSVALGGDVAGYPQAAITHLPPGEYWVQAVLHRYETFHRSDGHVVKLPPDRGEGQNWAKAPGNLVSTPRHVRIDAAGGSISVELDQALPEIRMPPDTRYLRHVQMKSELLSRFWGRDMFVKALVLLPEGWDSHPDAHYPVIIYHSHFGAELEGYGDQPPDEKLPPYSIDGLRRECPNGHTSGCAKNGYARYQAEAEYRFHQLWTGKGFPRVILVQIQHANPYYDDSYAVNSENLGPYGDAITRELVPYLEKTFRGLGPWARGMYGGSTGGWEAIAAQMFYPDEYNGAIANCPDPIDFRAYVTVNIYDDDNAYVTGGAFRGTPRASSREDDGALRSTMAQDNQMELALGTRSRSGQQYDIWEAVYSPVGADGYPRRIWDKRTGVIDKSVAASWRERYDLGHILTRDWATLGPKLAGKLRINVGNMDTYYLDRAVRLFQERLGALANPTPDVVVDYGARDGHCWSGDHDHKNVESRLTYHERFIPLLVDRFLRTAPAGADTSSWRY